MSAQQSTITLELLAQMGFKTIGRPVVATLEIKEEGETLFLRMTPRLSFSLHWELTMIFSSNSLKGNVQLRDITPSIDLLEALVSNHANFRERMRRFLETVQVD